MTLRKLQQEKNPAPVHAKLVTSGTLAIVERRPVVPILSAAERRAYQAAWKIMNVLDTFDTSQWPCPGTRRSRLVDEIAKVIRNEHQEHIPLKSK